MRSTSRFDLGQVQIHNKVLAEIVRSAVGEIEGVSLIKKNFYFQVVELLGQETIPGIDVIIDENSDVTLNVKVCIRYGYNIHDIAVQIQDAIKSAIERMAEINLKEINVNIQGLERGTNEIFYPYRGSFLCDLGFIFGFIFNVVFVELAEF